MNKFCPNCGKEVAEGSQFCDNCGAQINIVQQGTTQMQYGQQPVQQVPIGTQQKSKICAGLLAIFLGEFGIHNFYLGYTGKAVAQLLITLIGWIVCIGPFVSAIWALIEAVMIFTGSISTDSDGVPLGQ